MAEDEEDKGKAVGVVGVVDGYNKEEEAEEEEEEDRSTMKRNQ